jgi:ligand-binding sensor domain-containing protein/signal transduction histidine kinase
MSLLSARFLPVLALALAWVCPLGAAEFLLRNWQTEDSLPDNTITAIQQTTNGYLWLGTFNGLVRFDGVQFKTYDSANTPELRSSRILSLLADDKGALWIGTEGGGLLCLNNQRFSEVPLAALGGASQSASISSLFQETNGTVWAALEGGSVARILGARVDVLHLTNGIALDLLGQLTADEAVRHWLLARNDLLTFRAGSWFSRPSQVPPSGTEITAVQRSRNGSVWLAFPRNLLQISSRDGIVSRTTHPWGGEFSSALVTAVTEDRQGVLWVGTLNNGLFHSSSSGGTNLFLPVVKEGPLSQNVISALFEDRDGLLWAGTYRGGLFRIKRSNVATEQPPGAGEVNVETVCAARDGSVWLGTGGAGLYRFKDGAFARFTETNGLANLHVCSVFEDSRTNLWVGTWGGLFLRQGDAFRPAVGAQKLPERTLALFEDRAGDLWVGTYGGLARRHGTDSTLFTTADGLSHPDVRVMAEDREGNLWVGTAGGGLDRFRDGRFKHFGPEENFPHKMVLALHADPDGTLWIGTIGGGLTRYKDGRFTHFTTQDGLADNVVGGLLDDLRGNLWLSSQNGILRVSRQALAEGRRPIPCLSLSVGDGLSTPMCSGAGQPVAARTADGRLWIPNMKAVAIIDPARIQPRAIDPTVLIEEVSVDGKDFAPSGAPLRVRYGRSRFEIHYTVLGLPVPEAARFRTKLEGQDREWENAGQRRYAYYGLLPPGHYEFHVMAAGGDGVWHEAGTPLVLDVVPRIWELRSFQILAGMILVAVVAGAAFLNERRKLRRKLERVELQQALENERRRIARDLHDDLGARLTEIALMGEVAKRSAHSPAAFETQLGGITRKVRELILAMEEVVWTVNPKNDSLRSVATFLCDHTERFLTSAQIGCRFEVAEVLPPVTLTAPVRHNLLLAVKEALNNAVKHARAGIISLFIRVEGGMLHVAVADDGRGFDPGTARAGNGLQNMRSRLESLRGRAELSSTPGKGTTVTFSLPLPAAP